MRNMEERCPVCGSTNIQVVAKRAKNGEIIGWEVSCKDCGELIDED